MNDEARQWVPGVSTPLPPGERIRWRGAPERHALARRVFHARKIAIYFVLLLGWRAAASAGEHPWMPYFLAGAIPLALLGALCVGCSLLLARLTERATVYAVTDRRVVLRIGLVLQSTINIPFRQIQGASVKRHADGTGDIALRLGDQDRLAYLMLWPHARAWHFTHPQPTLRCLADPEQIGELLREGVLGVNEPPAPATAGEETAASEGPVELAVGVPAEAVA